MSDRDRGSSQSFWNQFARPPAEAGSAKRGHPWDVPVPPKREPDPPSGEYELTRAAMGHPSYVSDLAVTCPWCGSRPGRACVVLAIGKPLSRPHEEREKAAKEAATSRMGGRA